MARLPRLVVPDFAHLVLQRGHNGQVVFVDTVDQQAYLGALREAAAVEAVQVHAWALLGSEVRLLLTPQAAPALGRFMQAVGRRYVSAYNRRHHRAGTLWDGRFRASVVEPGALRLLALRWIDGPSATDDPAPALRPKPTTPTTPDAARAARAAPLTSAAQRLGGARDTLLTDPAEFWKLGNTPFEREAVYRQLLDAGLPPLEAVALRQAVVAGKALGSARFLSSLGEAAEQRHAIKPLGRPRRTPV